MPAADDVDARARRVAARLFQTGVRRVVQRPARPNEQDRTKPAARQTVGGHPARAARVSRAIQSLEPEGWVCLERVHRPGGNGRLIDHVMIGPGGIIVIDSRAWVGHIEVTRGIVQQDGSWRELECAEVALTAGSITALLPPQHRAAVHAVICVAQHELAEHLVAPGVHVVGVSGLARLLRALPPRLHPIDILRLHTQLRHTLAEISPPEQLTTAELDHLSRSGLPEPEDPTAAPENSTAAPGSAWAAPGSECLLIPVTDRRSRPSVRMAAHRHHSSPPRRGLDWRFLGARLLLAALVAVGAVVLTPGLLHRPAETVPTQQVETSASWPASPGGPAASPGGPAASPGGPTASPGEPTAGDVTPPAVTAQEAVATSGQEVDGRVRSRRGPT